MFLMLVCKCFCSGNSEDLDEKCPTFCPPSPLSPGKSGPSVSPLRAPGGRTKRVRTTSTSKAAPSVVHSGSRTIYTAGRPPWYDSHGQQTEAFVIGMCHHLTFLILPEAFVAF